MKLVPAYLALLLAAIPFAAAETAPAAAKPELRGVMDLGNGKRFLLALPDGSSSSWEKVGDAFGDWTIAEYRDQDQTLVLQGSDGAKVNLHVAASPAEATDAGDEVYALNYLQTRVIQLRQDYQTAKQDLAAFEKKHDGKDPDHLRDADAIAGHALVDRVAFTKRRYDIVLQRLKDAENAGALGPGPN
jgi:hypothetical protein